jgi:transcriptional regulator with XRE-family HTH domain
MREAKRFDLEVGRTIRRFRKAKDFTQEGLASALKLSRTSITNIESGRQALSLELAARIADVLGVPLTRLVPSPAKDAEVPEQALRNLEPRERKVVQRMIRSATSP